MAMNQRVQKILLELMRERHSLYAGFTDVELKSILKSHAGDVSACHATIQGLQDADGGRATLDWNEACEYAKSMGVSRRATTAAAYRDSVRSWFGGASARSSSRAGAQRAAPALAAREGRQAPARPTAARPPANPRGASPAALSPGTSSRAKRTAPRATRATRPTTTRPPRVVAADTVEPSSGEDDSEAASRRRQRTRTDEQRDIARLMVAGVAGGRPCASWPPQATAP
ncbi:hypothetical protein JL720_8998 [Aureococcus anophagefferens]|nr:hypothetical protein JL720_8998 [Aureococcus anophagefferens]